MFGLAACKTLAASIPAFPAKRPLYKWNVSKVTKLSYMFHNIDGVWGSFNQPLHAPWYVE